MTNISTPLTDDEATVLQIAAQQGTIGAIGRWEAPVKSLVKRGLLQDMTGDFFNCQITEAGKSAVSGAEAEEDKALVRAVDRMREMAMVQKQCQDEAEQCARVLCHMAMTCHAIKGDDKAYAAEQWGKVIIARAKELLR
jgi:hypothetical protein